MVVSTKTSDVAGDYNIFLAWVALGSFGVSFITMFTVREVSLSAYIGILCLMIAMTLRYFSDVEYRLNVNYRGLMVYYFVITAGYIAGLAPVPDCSQLGFDAGSGRTARHALGGVKRQHLPQTAL
jgi:hypothetical protein